jgi:protein TonB
MRPRLGFALSLLAACGIHAIVLFVPRAAFVENVQIPTVELELTDVSGRPAPAEQAAPVVARPIAAQAPARTDAPRQPDARPLAPDASPPGTEPPSAAPGGQAETPRFEQSVAPAYSDRDTAGAAVSPQSIETPPAASSASGSTIEEPGSATSAAAPGSTTVAVPSFIPPRPLSEILPKYPLSARRSGFEGVVKVTAVVDESGAVTSADVLSSSGHASLDQAALQAVRQARFAPALQGGKPIQCRIQIPIRFQLSASVRQ